MPSMSSRSGWIGSKRLHMIWKRENCAIEVRRLYDTSVNVSLLPAHHRSNAASPRQYVELIQEVMVVFAALRESQLHERYLGLDGRQSILVHHNNGDQIDALSETLEYPIVLLVSSISRVFPALSCHIDYLDSFSLMLIQAFCSCFSKCTFGGSAMLFSFCSS